MANEQKKFLVLFLIPVAVMDGWAKTDPTEKKAAEDKLKGEWDAWMKERAAIILSTEAAGKPSASPPPASPTRATTSS